MPSDSDCHIVRQGDIPTESRVRRYHDATGVSDVEAWANSGRARNLNSPACSYAPEEEHVDRGQDHSKRKGLQENPLPEAQRDDSMDTWGA